MNDDQRREERKKGNDKAREEIRNAVRAEILKEGLSKADMRRGAEEMIKEIIQNTLKQHNVAAMVEESVKSLVQMAVTSVAQNMPVKGEIRQTCINAIQKEAERLASEFVKTKVIININDAAAYPAGGTM